MSPRGRLQRCAVVVAGPVCLTAASCEGQLSQATSDVKIWIDLNDLLTLLDVKK